MPAEAHGCFPLEVGPEFALQQRADAFLSNACHGSVNADFLPASIGKRGDEETARGGDRP